jgi:hypothetical protein
LSTEVIHIFKVTEPALVVMVQRHKEFVAYLHYKRVVVVADYESPRRITIRGVRLRITTLLCLFRAVVAVPKEEIDRR